MWRPFPRLHVRSLRKLHVQTLAYDSDSPPLTHPALRIFKIIVDGETMSRSALLMAGITLITIPTIQHGGYFLLTSLRKSRQRIHGQPTSAELFPRRSRSRWRNCDSLARLPVACGFRRAPGIVGLGDKSGSTTIGDSYIRRVLSLDDACECKPT